MAREERLFETGHFSGGVSQSSGRGCMDRIKGATPTPEESFSKDVKGISGGLACKVERFLSGTL
jgi:hypothetical protein